MKIDANVRNLPKTVGAKAPTAPILTGALHKGDLKLIFVTLETFLSNNFCLLGFRDSPSGFELVFGDTNKYRQTDCLTEIVI